MGGVYWRIFQQCDRSGCRYRKGPMCTLDHSPANVEGRTQNLVHAERVDPNRRANNINNCVDSSDLVEMDALDRHIVNLGLGRSQSLKNGNRRSLCRIRNLSRRNGLSNFRQPAMRMLMFVWRGHSCPRTLTMRMVVSIGMLMPVMIMMFMRMRRFLFCPVLLPRHVLLTVNPDINFRCG